MMPDSRFGVIPTGVIASKVFPFYVVCDVSQSMWDTKFTKGQAVTPLETLERALPDMLVVLEDDPTTHDIAHLGVIAFGDTPVPVLPLTPLRHEPVIPRLPRQYATNYIEVFRFLDWQLRDDQQRFAGAKMATYTPVIFFLTDGNPQVNGLAQPDSAWLPIRRGLEHPDHPFRPIVVALGVGDVARATVQKLRSINPSGVACVAEAGVVPGDLLRSVINSIKFSITSSVGHGEFQFRTPAGMRRLD
jgi:uncharacterized protein YegL